MIAFSAYILVGFVSATCGILIGGWLAAGKYADTFQRNTALEVEISRLAIMHGEAVEAGDPYVKLARDDFLRLVLHLDQEQRATLGPHWAGKAASRPRVDPTRRSPEGEKS